jgi:hypothetical protein
MRILFGHRPRPVRMSATRLYHPEQLWDVVHRLHRNGAPLFLQVENHRIPLGARDLPLATSVVVSYHNQLAYNAPAPDGWAEETVRMEAAAVRHMEAPLSEGSHDEEPDARSF